MSNLSQFYTRDGSFTLLNPSRSNPSQQDFFEAFTDYEPVERTTKYNTLTGFTTLSHHPYTRTWEENLYDGNLSPGNDEYDDDELPSMQRRRKLQICEPSNSTISDEDITRWRAEDWSEEESKKGFISDEAGFHEILTGGDGTVKTQTFTIESDSARKQIDKTDHIYNELTISSAHSKFKACQKTLINTKSGLRFDNSYQEQSAHSQIPSDSTKRWLLKKTSRIWVKGKEQD
ncbi:uncharacterized protein L201_001705 [Kwoniella dendrophila CBS 6074]|uniref:Uncharacterized protein n=1 Tax=Kwoniella dendrophila CBS 6074 TaxID=1295534 RepID=A0AAX4JP22_9TREE